MSVERVTLANEYFQAHLGLELSDLERPLEEQDPCGPYLRGNGLYSEINEARRSDDPSLPRGEWEIELKRADWIRVSQLTKKALTGSSKDLQLTAWLLESEVQQRGFSAIAPCLILIKSLLDNFWSQINPPLDQVELRYNIFLWLDEKIPLVINRVPLAFSQDYSERFTGADIERALVTERRIESRAITEEEAEGVRLPQITQLISRTPDQGYKDYFQDLHEALAALKDLKSSLDQHFGESEAPGLGNLQNQLQQCLEFVSEQLNQRSLLDNMVDEESEQVLPEMHEDQAPDLTEPETAINTGYDRQAAYRQLEQIAEFLVRVDPHSPAPYLVKKAVDWGRLNTAELYSELFLLNKGQLDVFELLGIEMQQGSEG